MCKLIAKKEEEKMLLKRMSQYLITSRVFLFILFIMRTFSDFRSFAATKIIQDFRVWLYSIIYSNLFSRLPYNTVDYRVQ